MYVYVLSFIFMNAEGAYKKYSVSYKTVELAIEYVERDMMSQYGGAFMSTWTDAVKQNIIGSGNYFFRYGENQHYIMIERMEVQEEQPSNIDNVVIFGASAGAGANQNTQVQSPDDVEEEAPETIEEEAPETVEEETIGTVPETVVEEAPETVMEETEEEVEEEAPETVVPETIKEEAPETVVEESQESTIGDEIMSGNSGVDGYSNAPGPESITMNAPVISNKKGGVRRTRRAKRAGKGKTRKSSA
jgi:hypothetical protein